MIASQTDDTELCNNNNKYEKMICIHNVVNTMYNYMYVHVHALSNEMIQGKQYTKLKCTFPPQTAHTGHTSRITTD